MIVIFSKRSMSIYGSILLITLLFAACSGNQLAPTQTAAEPTSTPVEEAAEAAANGESAPETPTAEAAQEAGAENAAQPETAASAPKTFQIMQEGTQARFYIDEVLMGNDKTVVGVTSLVEGELAVDPAHPGSTQIGTIRIDARDLTTDSDRRNGAIQRFVLQSNQDQYQYITFEPTAIEGMPDTVTIGQPFEFRVAGNLTIRDVTNAVTFGLTVTANSADELVGLGKTTIQRADYSLTIPSVPSVANVAEEVPLEIEFTARAVE